MYRFRIVESSHSRRYVIELADHADRRRLAAVLDRIRTARPADVYDGSILWARVEQYTADEVLRFLLVSQQIY